MLVCEGGMGEERGDEMVRAGVKGVEKGFGREGRGVFGGFWVEGPGHGARRYENGDSDRRRRDRTLKIGRCGEEWIRRTVVLSNRRRSELARLNDLLPREKEKLRADLYTAASLQPMPP